MADDDFNTDSEDELPHGWEERVSIEGRVFYAWWVNLTRNAYDWLSVQPSGEWVVTCTHPIHNQEGLRVSLKFELLPFLLQLIYAAALNPVSQVILNGG